LVNGDQSCLTNEAPGRGQERLATRSKAEHDVAQLAVCDLRVGGKWRLFGKAWKPVVDFSWQFGYIDN